MRSGASCGQAGDPAGNTSTSCGPRATGQRRVWDSSSLGWARPQWPAIVCDDGSRNCGARSYSIRFRRSMCCSWPAGRAMRPPWPSSDRTSLPGWTRCSDLGFDVAPWFADRRSPPAPPCRAAAGVAVGQHLLGSDSRISSLDLPGAAAGLSLFPDLLRLRPGGARAPRRAQGELVGHPSHRPLPSMASGWRRPGSLTR